MKKTIIAAILASSILLSACSAIENVTADTPSSNTAALPTEQITIETPVPDATVSPIVTASPDPTPEIPEVVVMPDAEQDIEETTKNVAAMMPILDSIIRVTGTTGSTEYAPDDPDFFGGYCTRSVTVGALPTRSWSLVMTVLSKYKRE